MNRYAPLLNIHSPSEPTQASIRDRRLLFLGLGVLVGELAFLVAFPAGEDFWSHYLWGQGFLGRLSAEQIAAIWPYRFGYDDRPILGLLTLPLALLGPLLALRVWTVLSMISLGIALALLARRLVPRSQALGAATLFLIWPPAFEALFRGQTSPWWLLALALAWAFGRRGKHLVAGAWASGAGWIKPHLSLPLLLGAALRKRDRWLWGLAAATLGLLPFSWLGQQAMPPLDWRPYLTGWYFNNPLSVSAIGRLHFLPWPAQAALSGLGYLGLGLWWWRTRRATAREAGLAVVANLMLAPHLRAYDLAILAPLYFLLWDRRDVYFWASWVLVSVGSVGALRFGLGDLVPLGLFLQGAALWRRPPAVEASA